LTDKIVSISATGSIEITQKINLCKIFKTFSNCEYNSEKFPALIMRIENPKSSILIFSTGKMVITGLKEESDIKLIFNLVLERLNRLGLKYINPNLTIRSKVIRNGTGRLHAIKLNKRIL